MREKVLDFNKMEKCTGCSACASVCPKGAISFIQIEGGFAIPDIDRDACVGCRRCEQVCPIVIRSKAKCSGFLSGFVFSSDNRETALGSASGGAFSELAYEAVDAGGCACGCVWTEKLTAEHRVARNHGDARRFESSKYVQSKIDGIYTEVKDELELGRKVVFGGTPCQVEAIGRYCGKDRDNLLLVSVVCRGASSPSVWEYYKRGLERRVGSRLVVVNQRDKSAGYSQSACRYEFENGTVLKRSTYISDLYTNCFACGITLRESCYQCPAKGYSNADVILGDDVLHVGSPGGATLILCVTPKGENWIRRVLSGRGNLLELDQEQISLVSERSNMLLNSSSSPRGARERLFHNIREGVPADSALMRSLPLKQQIKVCLDKIGFFSLAMALKARAHG